MIHEAVINEIKAGEFTKLNPLMRDTTLEIIVGYIEQGKRFPSQYNDRDGQYQAGDEIVRAARLCIIITKDDLDGWCEVRCDAPENWVSTTEVDRVNAASKFGELRKRMLRYREAKSKMDSPRLIGLEIQNDLINAGIIGNFVDATRLVNRRDEIIAYYRERIQKQLAEYGR